MTTIVGIKTPTGVLLAADTLLTSASGDPLGTCSKLISLDGVCLAVAGPYTTILAIQDCLSEQEFENWSTNLDIYRNLTALHGSLKEGHYMRVEDDGEPFEKSQFQMLVGTKDRLWMVLHMREVIAVEDFNAVGSGREYALGSMCSVTKSIMDKEPARVASVAIRAAAKYDSATGTEMTSWQA